MVKDAETLQKEESELLDSYINVYVINNRFGVLKPEYDVIAKRLVNSGYLIAKPLGENYIYELNISKFPHLKVK